MIKREILSELENLDGIKVSLVFVTKSFSTRPSYEVSYSQWGRPVMVYEHTVLQNAITAYERLLRDNHLGINQICEECGRPIPDGPILSVCDQCRGRSIRLYQQKLQELRPSGTYVQRRPQNDQSTDQTQWEFVEHYTPGYDEITLTLEYVENHVIARIKYYRNAQEAEYVYMRTEWHAYTGIYEITSFTGRHRTAAELNILLLLLDVAAELMESKAFHYDAYRFTEINREYKPT